MAFEDIRFTFFFRGADCDTEHYLVVANLRKRLSVSKRVAQKFHKKRFNPKKLNDAKVMEVN
jgi:hypothetical protein